MTKDDFPIAEAEEKIGYVFKDKNLLIEAFTHVTYANKFGVKSNERLEFLGDAVLEMAVSENLYAAFPDSTEGEMTNLRQRYVAKPPLEKAAEKLGIVKYLLYYGGAADNVGKKAKSSLTESVIAAIYLDGNCTKGGGYENAKSFINANVEFSAEENYKGDLQEFAQGRGQALPVYREEKKSGVNNAPLFVVTVEACGKSARGEGETKQSAECEAAKKLLAILKSENN